MRKKLSELKEECAKVERDFSKLDITLMTSLDGDRSQIQELFRQLEELGVQRVVEVKVYEPFFEGDYRAKLEQLAKIAL
jgi:hypothetical protein